MSSEPPLVAEEAFRLREYLGVLRVRKWSIIAITLLAVLGALFYATQQTPTYQSVAHVRATNALGQVLSSNFQALTPDMPTEQATVASEPVTKCAWILFSARNPNAADTLCTDAALAAVSTPGALTIATPSAPASPS